MDDGKLDSDYERTRRQANVVSPMHGAKSVRISSE